MSFSKAADDPQAQAEARVCVLGSRTLKPLKNGILLHGIDATSVISNLHACPALILIDPNFDRTPGSVLDRVLQKIIHHLLQACSVPIADDLTRCPHLVRSS